MRRLSRGITVLTIIAALAVPAHAKPAGGDGFASIRNRLVKMLKKYVAAVLDDGDTMSVPKP